MLQFHTKACLLIILALIGTCGRAASVTLVAPDCTGAAGADVKASVQVRESEGMGSFQLELVYDPAVLEVKDVETGALLGGAMLAFNVVELGRLRIAAVGDPQKPIQGSGELAVVGFRMVGDGGKGCSLRLENALAWEQTNDALDMLVKTEPGKFAIARAGAGPSALWVAVVFLVLIGIVVLLAKKRPAKTG